MEIERQHIMVKKGSKIICQRDDGKDVLAELIEDICCWPMTNEIMEVKQLEVLEEDDKR